MNDLPTMCVIYDFANLPQYIQALIDRKICTFLTKKLIQPHGIRRFTQKKDGAIFTLGWGIRFEYARVVQTFQELEFPERSFVNNLPVLGSSLLGNQVDSCNAPSGRDRCMSGFPILVNPKGAIKYKLLQ